MNNKIFYFIQKQEIVLYFWRKKNKVTYESADIGNEDMSGR